jgi:hypothetical protein
MPLSGPCVITESKMEEIAHAFQHKYFSSTLAAMSCIYFANRKSGAVTKLSVKDRARLQIYFGKWNCVNYNIF